jgi:hypothetical protein
MDHKLTGWLQTILRSIKIKLSDLFFPAIRKDLQINGLGKEQNYPSTASYIDFS